MVVGRVGGIKTPPDTARIPSVLRVKRAHHSFKPVQVRNLIAAWYPDAAKLEMFARESHAGWDTFGNEVSGTLLDQEPRPFKFEVLETAPHPEQALAGGEK